MLMIVLAIAATACGSSSGSKAAPPTTTSTKPSLDQRVIAAGLIRPSDLPGYSHKPRTTSASPEIDQVVRSFPGCEHFASAYHPGAHKRRSPRFERSGALLGSSVDVYPSTAAIAAQLDLYRNPTSLPCLREAARTVVTHNLGTTGTVKSLEISPISVNILGDGEIAYRFTATVARRGETTTGLLDFVGVAVGRFALSFNAEGTTARLAELETALLPKLVDRMKQAGA